MHVSASRGRAPLHSGARTIAGNRSALDWVIDQYQISEDKRSGIRSDPNRDDDEEYIVRLVGQVIRVSLETVKIVKGCRRGMRRGQEKNERQVLPRCYHEPGG